MQICVIKNTEPRNTSIPVSMAVGGVSGLTLRQFLPIGKAEMDSFMFDQTETIKADSVNTAKNKFLKNIQDTLKKEPDNQALKLFLKRNYAKKSEDKKSVKDQIKSTTKEIQDKIASLRSELAAKIKAAKNLTDANIKAAAKQARPIYAFLLPGIALGALGGYIYNIIGAIKEN